MFVIKYVPATVAESDLEPGTAVGFYFKVLLATSF